jgi:hypothetical protein
MSSKLTTSLFLTAAALLFVLSLGLRTQARSCFEAVLTDDDRFYLPPAGWLRLFSLGYNEAVTDLVWVKTILYFGENIKIAGGGRFVMNYLDTALALDPRFQRLYVAGSVLTLYQEGGKVSRRSVDMSMRILERGQRELPNDGEIAFYLGFLHYYEATKFTPADPDAPETRRHLDMGRRLIGRSALMPNAPPYAARYSVSLYQEGGVKELVVAHLKALLAKETAPEVREALIASLRQAVGDAARRDIAATNRLQAAWRADMPYIPFDLYVLLGPEYDVRELVNPLFRFDAMLGLDDGQAPGPPESPGAE